MLDRTYEARDRAAGAHQAAKAATFAQLNGDLTALIDMIDGADAPVPGGTVAAYCELRGKVHAAFSERNPACEP